MTDDSAPRRFPRFTRSDRLEHWVQVIAFTGLAITGLVQMWSESAFPKVIITGMGGINSTRFIHRALAIVILVATAYHLGTAGYRFFVKRIGKQMLPNLNDVRAAAHSVSYNIGFRADRAQEGKFTFAEKLEYWSIIWGTVIMAVTGLMMWNPVATTKILPGELIPAAKAAHGGEAILAVLAILVWHTYFVHVRRFNKSIFTGYLDEEEMIDEHPVQLAAIESGDDTITIPPETLRRRRRVFFPVYAAIVILAAAAVLVFLSYQEIAITTVEPRDVGADIYTPYVP
jgi:formate dehydrogenase gamma subunit